MRHIAAVAAVVQLLACSANADEPVATITREVGDMEAIQVADGNDIASISLEDVAAYHGHPCPGSTVAFRAVQLGSRLLWNDTIPQRKDIVIFSRGSMYGVLDVFALVTKGAILPKIDAISQPSPVLKAMPASQDAFTFTIIRRSTGQAVDLRLAAGVYPKGFFALRRKVKRDSASPAEQQRLKQFQQELIEAVPRLEDGKLFDRPVRYRVLMFGA